MAAKPRPGGRSARNKAAVFEAAATLLAERGHEAVTMTDIAGRAGLAATSLYRRWGDVRALMMEVAVEKLMRERPLSLSIADLNPATPVAAALSAVLVATAEAGATVDSAVSVSNALSPEL